MVLAIISLVVSMLSFIVAVFAIVDSRRINKSTEKLLLKIEKTIMVEEQHRKSELAKVRKLIDGNDFDD